MCWFCDDCRICFLDFILCPVTKFCSVMKFTCCFAFNAGLHGYSQSLPRPSTNRTKEDNIFCLHECLIGDVIDIRRSCKSRFVMYVRHAWRYRISWSVYITTELAWNSCVSARLVLTDLLNNHFNKRSRYRGKLFAKMVNKMEYSALFGQLIVLNSKM